MLDLEQVASERAKRSFYFFVKLAWPWMQPEPFVDNWDIGLVCETLQAVQALEIRELVICKPPATTKSRILSCLWPVWLWLKDPAEKVLMASYGEKPLKDFGDHRRRLITSEQFRRAFPDAIILDGGGDLDYGNTALGWHRSTTCPRGQVTGLHGTRRIVDDSIKPDEVDGAGLEAVNTWYGQTWASRATDFTRVTDVVSQQRVHDRDLIRKCLDMGYQSLIIPMEYRKAYSHPKDPRTAEGELLNPKRFPAEYVAKQRLALGPRDYAAQYQQDPVPEGGAIFHADWFQTWTTLPPGGRYVHSWDCAFKDEADSDYVVGMVWYHVGAQFYLVDVVRDRLDFVGTVKEMLTLLAKYPSLTVLVEDKANGSAVLSTLKKRVPGMTPVEPEGGKIARANAVTGVCEAKQVFFPAAAPWLADLLTELSRFPRGKNDDQVDALTQAIHWLSTRAMLDVTAIANALSDDALIAALIGA